MKAEAGAAHPLGVSTLHWAGEAQVARDQPHALGIHELVRGQDLPQQPLAGAEGLQNLSKARTTCKGNRTSGTGTRAPARPTQVPRKAAEAIGPSGWGCWQAGRPVEQQSSVTGNTHCPAPRTSRVVTSRRKCPSENPQRSGRWREPEGLWRTHTARNGVALETASLHFSQHSEHSGFQQPWVIHST